VALVFADWLLVDGIGEQGWGAVTSDCPGLGTAGPTACLIGPDAAHVLDALATRSPPDIHTSDVMSIFARFVGRISPIFRLDIGCFLFDSTPTWRNMKFARLGPIGREIPVVISHDEVALDLRPLTPDITGEFLAEDPVARVQAAIAAGRLSALSDAESLRRGAPVARPGKVVCIGLNYRDHAEETGAAVPDEPVVFMKDPTTVIGPDDTVLIPRGSVKTDWEVELAVIIGRTARYLSNTAEAASVIAGYTISNDVSEREYQLERGGQWDKGKSCETFNPMGPVLVTPDEIDPCALGLRLEVNGSGRQNGSTSDMIFPVFEVIRYLSQFMVLHAGDVVNTGTPAGVALAGHAPYLRAGDVMTASIDGLGAQRQEVRAA
jgi:2-keto-4-pentenoate hydratase/2-oxohepta-3-ene-1,7-dioic acid hydratase in catechol pathway